MPWALRAFVLAVGLFAAPVSRAEDPTAVRPEDRLAPPSVRNPEGRSLGSHVFPRLAFVPSAFTETRFSLRQGVVAISVPELPVSTTYSEDVRTFGVTETIEVGVQLFDRLELFAALGGQVVTGVEIPSILTLGTNYTYSYGGGATLRFFTLNLTDTLFSARVSATHNPGGSYELIKLIDAVRNLDVTRDEVVRGRIGRLVRVSSERSELNAHLVVAQPVLRNLGIQAAFGITQSWLYLTAFDRDRQRDVETGSTDTSPDLSVGLDGNLTPFAPIGFSAEYSFRGQRPEITNASAPEDLTHVVALGVHWVHPRLQLSLCFGKAFGLEPLVRELDTTNTQRSGAPSLHYGLLLVHINPPR